MKKNTDLSPYSYILPYDSEIFGVYQPLLGWRSRRMFKRLQLGFANDIGRAFAAVHAKHKGHFEIALNADRSMERIRRLELGTMDRYKSRVTDSFVLDSIASNLPPEGGIQDADWDKLIQSERLKATLTNVVIPQVMEWHKSASEQERRAAGAHSENLVAQVADQLNRESVVAGYLLHLASNKHYGKLQDIFYKSDEQQIRLLKLLTYHNSLDYMDPMNDLGRASLSPIGVVHLFRQYFFEFDTFLGPPVSHVWMSPGSTVELVEINTRRTLVERTLESSTESTVKTESSATEEDELSDAVKEDNRSDTKFGFATTVNQSWVGGEASASANIDLTKTQGKAREVSHRHMRQQTEKLSTEIRRNYKSTFKTLTETNDTSSKRYVLANNTQELINYELRRKMRQVGVQVQDIGTYLCWQTYVDDPGRQLGIAKLVHIAKSPDLGPAPSPESLALPTPVTTELAIDIHFEQKSEDRGDLDEGYRDGKEVDDEGATEGELEKIRANFDGYVAVCEQAGYQFGGIEFDYGGNDIRVSLRNPVEDPPGNLRFGIHLDYVNFRGNSPIRITAKVKWLPQSSMIEELIEKNKQQAAEFDARSKLEFQRAFVEAARERIKLASKIDQRRFEDLREEERIVVYRALIQEMLTKDIPMPDDRTRHVVSELLNSIFDVEKMLYFVAPEWWRPRLHHSHQLLGGMPEPPGIAPVSASLTETVHGKIKKVAKKGVVDNVLRPVEDSQISPTETVTWGGTKEFRQDNYYITEESDPAKLGSSLGWLLQLDGDDLRNAFLNAPWVKAVIPIRPGKERAAMNWLERVHVEGTEGLDDAYVAPSEELAEIPHSGSAATIRDAIHQLCTRVAEKHAQALRVDRYPTDEINDDNRVSSTPIDKVYEHGFYPLQGGFRVQAGTENFEVFDQWVEVLPTDQVVPVEVTYDPRSGRQL